MFCSACGKEMPDHAKFCPVCGLPIRKPQGQAVPAEATPQQGASGRVVQIPLKDPASRPSRGVGEGKSFSFRPYLFKKGSLKVTNRDIRIDMPKRPILGIIPTGNETENLPLRNVSSVRLGKDLNYKRFFAGILIGLLGFLMVRILGSHMRIAVPAGLLLVVIGAVVFLTGLKTDFIIEKSGAAFRIGVWFFDRRTFVRIEKAIRSAMDYEADKNDLGRQADILGEANAAAMLRMMQGMQIAANR